MAVISDILVFQLSLTGYIPRSRERAPAAGRPACCAWTVRRTPQRIAAAYWSACQTMPRRCFGEVKPAWRSRRAGPPLGYVTQGEVALLVPMACFNNIRKGWRNGKWLRRKHGLGCKGGRRWASG